MGTRSSKLFNKQVLDCFEAEIRAHLKLVLNLHFTISLRDGSFDILGGIILFIIILFFIQYFLSKRTSLGASKMCKEHRN